MDYKQRNLDDNVSSLHLMHIDFHNWIERFKEKISKGSQRERSLCKQKNAQIITMPNIMELFPDSAVLPWETLLVQGTFAIKLKRNPSNDKPQNLRDFTNIFKDDLRQAIHLSGNEAQRGRRPTCYDGEHNVAICWQVSQSLHHLLP